MSVLNDLKKPTPTSEIKYRVGSVYDKDRGKGTVLSYVDARYVQDTLDRLIGPEFWENRFYEAKGALFCEITINIDGVKISKSDCGTESDIAPAKGEASDAFKRAAVMFGIGRDLYSAETHYADLEKKGLKWALPRGWKPPLKAAKLKDLEVKVDMVDFADKLTTPPLPNGTKENSDWDGSEIVYFGKYRNNSGDKSKNITWSKLPDDYLTADWWEKMSNADLKDKCKWEIDRRNNV